jgi:hypothetical protein
MFKPGLKGRFPRSLFLLLLLGAMTAGLDGCAGYGYSVGASYGYPYRYQYPYSPYGYYRYYPHYSTDSAIDPGSRVTIGPIGDLGGHPVTSSMVITSIIIDWTWSF